MTDARQRHSGYDRGVSPVVATVLLLGITLLLAATASVYFVSLTDPPETEPDVDFEYNYNRVCLRDDVFYVTHAGGEDLDPDRTYVVYDDNRTSFADLGIDDPMTAGDTIRLKNSNYSQFPEDFDDETLRIVWVHPENEDSFVLGKYEFPEHGCSVPRVGAPSPGLPP